MYGTPSEALEPLKTLTLDLPSKVSWVADPAQGSSALYLKGPLQEGVSLAQLPTTMPATVNYTAGQSVVSFEFAEAIPPGTYWVVVHESRLKDMSDDSLTLLTETAKPWTGWALTVLSNPRALATPGVDEPFLVEEVLNPPIIGLAPALATVTLDGTAIPSGTGGLSGEVLSVETSEEGRVELVVEYLIRNQSQSLYELYLKRSAVTVNESSFTTNFTSAGPIDDYQWAVYHGQKTDGTLPLNDDGTLLVAEPVTREPKGADKDPFISYAIEEDYTPSGHVNSYDVVTYTVEPAKSDTPASYESVKLVFPTTLVDEDNTPATNPKLFPGGLYYPDNVAVLETAEVAVFDLPIAARLHVKINGVEVWWGQTRLLPMMSTAQRFYMLQGGTALSPAELSDLELQIWRASTEALSFWGCTLPTTAAGKSYVPSTMEEFVLTRLALGWPLQDGFQGGYSVRLGDHMFSGQSDHSLKRRLQALASLLGDCQASAPLFPDDDMAADVAMIASEADPTRYPSTTVYRLFWPMVDLTYPNVIKIRELYDPREYARRALG